jgi:putative CocE/NonD family hydrolase
MAEGSVGFASNIHPEASEGPTMNTQVHRMARSVLGLLLAAGALSSPASAQDPGQTFDYMQIQGLSQPEYQVARTSFEVPMWDGITMYVEVVKPTTPGRYPVIMELSPYHGTSSSDRVGDAILPYPDGLTDYFPQRGYAVVIADLRGTGRSQGCLDTLGPNDAKDAKSIVEWAATQPWSNGRVGMTGMSYPAMAATLAATQVPQGLVTVVPIGGAFASVYNHQFQAGVPYAFQWAGPIASYPAQGTQRHLPPLEQTRGSSFGTGDNFGNDPQYTGCGWASGSSLNGGEGQLSGQYSAWHAARDYTPQAIASPVPMFVVHGIYDQAARVIGIDWFFDRPAGRGDKLWLGSWNHGAPRWKQFEYAIHAWFDHHLKQLDVPTGPPVEVFFSDGDTFETAQYFENRTEVLATDHWPAPDSFLGLYPRSGGLASAPAAPATFEFTGDPRDTNDARLYPEYGENAEKTGNVTFVSEPATEDTLFLGIPKLRLSASVSVPRVHLIATLYDQNSAGARRRLTTFAMNPERRNGIAEIAPVVPSVRMDLNPPGFPMAHHLRAGHRLVLRVTTSQFDKIALFGVDPKVTVYTGPGATFLELPVIADPVLLQDTVSLGFEPPEEPE